MTSIASANSAALLILRQTNDASNAGNSSNQTSPADDLTSTVNGVSSENSPAKTKASSAINGALLDLKEKQDSTVQAALDFIDSDNFKASDLTLKDTLKKLISENGEDFAKKVQAWQVRAPGISLENALINAVKDTITDNREQFTSGEIILGIKFPSGGAAGLTSIPALDGSSEHGTLIDARKAELAEFSARIRAGETEFKPDDGSHHTAMQDWANKWFDEFGWDDVSLGN
ncbi:hypothetical protein ABID21_005037 [Pseudorhizobium tarimense]|uniref:Uncharacterized protein n=1 Tax=Pseudorhizobium tarimense TaxID=1079109 RepID=A0ABV2HEB7_9HYPH|nr:hypothetical protein [Pseudorhizobium tarimense]MCJ8521863.1 hypothetical protein [Pseudorhizobium tarimense]